MTVIAERRSGTTQEARAGIEDASEEDLRDLIALLSASRPDSSPQTVWDLPWTWPTYRVVRGAHGRVIAAAALAEIDPFRSEIRGLAVARTARRQGLASRLVEDLLARAESAGRDIVCMTRQPKFFERFGFRRTSPVWLPEQRWMPAPCPDAPRVAMCRPPADEVAA